MDTRTTALARHRIAPAHTHATTDPLDTAAAADSLGTAVPVDTRPLIGVTPLVDYGRESYWMLPGYFQGIAQAGGIPVMLPLTADAATLAQLADTLDGLVIAGGQDVAPALYGDHASEAAARCGELSPERDAMEAQLVRLALERDLPLLGICRGIQLMNAALGGTLWQDLPTQHPSAVEHHGTPPYDEPVHTVRVLEETPLAQALDGCPAGIRMDGGTHGKATAQAAAPAAKAAANPSDAAQGDSAPAPVDLATSPQLAAPTPTEPCNLQTLPVNSYHHQAVRKLAPGLAPMALAPDGIVEALWRPNSRFLWAVQWHPEFAWRVDAPSRAIFAAFVGAAGER